MKSTKKKSVKNKPRKPKPILKWQTGAYDRYAEFEFWIPYQSLLLSKLTDVTPKKLVPDFLDNLSCEAWAREGRDKAKEYLINYFIEMGYGQPNYTEADLRDVFKEMDAVAMLFPANGKMKLTNSYSKWRSKHYNFWFKKWFRKIRRKV